MDGLLPENYAAFRDSGASEKKVVVVFLRSSLELKQGQRGR